MHKFYCSAIGDNDKDMYESKYGDPKMKKKKKKEEQKGGGRAIMPLTTSDEHFRIGQ